MPDEGKATQKRTGHFNDKPNTDGVVPSGGATFSQTTHHAPRVGAPAAPRPDLGTAGPPVFLTPLI